MTKTLSLSLSLLALVASTLAATGCAANPADDETEAPEPTATTEQAVVNNGGGPVYSCRNGVCQCQGAEVCGRMFLICKSNLHCNYDEQGGLRCICLNYSPRSIGGRAAADLDRAKGTAEVISP